MSYPNFEELKKDRHNAPAKNRFRAIISKNKKWVAVRHEINGEVIAHLRISAATLLFPHNGMLYLSNPGACANNYEKAIYNSFPVAKGLINGIHGDFIAQQIENIMNAEDAAEQEEENDEPPITADTILNNIQAPPPEQSETKQATPAQPVEEPPPPPPPSGIDDLLAGLGFGLTPTPEPEPETKPTAADRINRINELNKQFEESRPDRTAARNRFLESRSKKD